jgi:dienelactone hydrolase
MASGTCKVNCAPDKMSRLCLLTGLIVFGLLILILNPLAQQEATCEWLRKPVDDKTFKTYLEFFTYDKNLPFDMQIIDTKEYEGIRKEHLSFQSTPGERVFGNLYSAAGPSSKKEPAIILLHGGSAPGKDDPRMNGMGELLARVGWRVLAIDMKHFGGRSTDLLTTFSTEEKVEKFFNNPPTYLGWTIQTIKDISRSFDFLIEQKDADPDKTSLIGVSRGAVVAPIACAVERRLAGIMMFYGGHSGKFKHMPAACPANYIGRISPKPLLMINGTRDIIFDKDTAVLPLYNLAKEPKKIDLG